MLTRNALLVEQAKIVNAFAPATPSSAVPARVSLKNYSRCTILINVANATTVTGSAITLLQSQDVSGTAEKALALSNVWANTDTGAGEDLTQTAVTSNTFTTNNTNSKNLQYVIEVGEDDLDVNNAFDCIRLGLGNATAAVIGVTYILWPAKFARPVPPSAGVN